MKSDDVKPAVNPGSDRLAIIGIGCLFPGAQDKETYWANIREGIDAISDIPATHWKVADYFNPDPKSPDHTYGKRGGFLSPYPFNPLEFNIPPNTLEAIDTSQLLGLVTAGQALRDAGYGPEQSYDRSRVSVILGVTGAMELVIPLGARLGHPIWRTALKDAGVDEAVAEDVVQRIAEGYVPWQENSFPGLLGNVVAGRISKQFDLGGTNCVVDAACASSMSALHLAGMELASGKADMVVAGGIDTFNDIFMYMCFSKTPALSASGNAKPFDADGDGTILGEGLGIVVIKRLADAERDGDRIYAVIKGIGSSSDGKGDAIYAPSAAGQKRALLDAYNRAGVAPESIGLLEAHGTGTKVGDAVEVSALREVYGEAARPWCALGSVKSQIGHTKAAAGVAGLIKATLALHHKVIPPTIKVSRPLDVVGSGESPFYLATEKRPWLPHGDQPRRAGVSAFGFGGSNFHTVLEEYTPEKSVVDWDGNAQIVALAAGSAAALAEKLAAVPAAGTWDELRAFAAASRKDFDRSAPARLALTVERDKTNLAAMVATVQGMLQSRPAGSWSTPDGAFFAAGPAAAPTALLFPGQGSQYTGMLRDLACAFPQLAAALTAADSDCVFSDGSRLSDRIYPPTDFAADAKERQEALLRATEAAQPAIGAVSLGALRILESFGLAPAATAGHSYGELTALCAAGCISEADLHRLSRLRGRLMADGDGDRGSMLAVPAPLAQIEQILADEGLDLVIANRNAPNQAVLSGSSAEIDRAATAFAARNLACKQLPVAAAFHSPLVAAAAAPFQEALAKVALTPGAMPVYANTTAAVYPAEPAAARELLANQLARPVEFVAEIEAMYAAGIRTFVEVGPGARLCALVKAILGERDHQALALDASNGKRAGMFDLARLLANLAVLGHELHLDRWDEGFVPPLPVTGKKPALIVPICGANYVQPRPKRAPAPVIPATKPAVVASTGPVPESAAAPRIAPASRDALAESLRLTRESMALLQKMQEDTARLHRQFLDGQEAAGRTFQSLLENQQRLLMGGPLLQPVQAPQPTATAPHSFAPAVAPAPPAAAPPAAVAAPVPTAAVMPAASTAAADTATALLAVVSEKTGYPVEMLDLDMGLDADLGIDSIKRVEILSAIQEKLPNAPLIGPEHLGSLQTLGEIAAFLGNGSAVAPAVTAAAPAVAVQTGGVDAASALLAVVSEKTGYPVEMLDLDMGLDADLGIDSIKRVEILSAIQERLPGAPLIGPEHLGSLQTLGEIAAFLGGGAPVATEPAPAAAVIEPTATAAPAAAVTAPALMKRSALGCTPAPATDAAPLSLLRDGEILITDDGSHLAAQLFSQLQERGLKARLLAADDDKGIFSSARLAGLIILAPKGGTDDRFLENAFLLVKRAAPALRQAGESEGALFATVSRLDGCFGCGEGTTLADPLSGGLAGLVKTAAHEWPEVTCRAIDLGDFPDQTTAASALAAELLRVGPVETGLSAAGRSVLQLVDLPAAPTPDWYPVGSGDVVVITGGGRGVTAAAAIALTQACHPTLLLLGRSAAPEPEPAWLAPLAEESRIKRAILENAGGKLHPKEIEERYQQVIAGRELKGTLERVAAAGGTVLYRAVDIRNGAEVAALLQEIRAEYGPIRGIVHGAGVLADRLITDKSREQFAAVYGTKVFGLRSLFAATEADELRFIALFSSTTGRFGRTGQVDYAVANEVLNKLAQDEARRRPGCRTVSINWGPWDGGMVTPALKKLFAGEGVGLIGLAEGGDFLAREIAASEAPVEIVALAETAIELTTPQPAKVRNLTEAFAVALSLNDYPFLRSHVLDGKAVLPMAVIAEWLAHGALHGNPGLRFHGFNDLRICKGVVFEQERVCQLKVMAGKAEKRDSFYLVPVELTGVNGDSRLLLHARAEIVLATKLPEGIRSIKEAPSEPYEPHNGRIYDRERLFHGPDLHGIELVSGCSPKGIAALVTGAPAPSAWLKQPLRSSWLTDPLVLDSAFQLMILWSFERFGSGSLPCFAGRYRQFQESFPKEGVQVVIRISDERKHGAHADMEFVDRQSGKLVARLEDYECVIDPSLGVAFQRNQLEKRVGSGAL